MSTIKKPKQTAKPATTVKKSSSKKPEAKPSPATSVVPETNKIDLNKPAVKDAIAQGKMLLKDGKSKADASRLIYSLLKDEDKNLIVAAFIAGATLTEKGALTYWYNCRRKQGK